MVHSHFQDLCTSCPRGRSEAQNLRQHTLSSQLFLHIASHDLVVDCLLVGVVTLINYQ